jgi:peptidoglycan/xylan/chitin deacetylase (PgdA/CDA1 family)
VEDQAVVSFCFDDFPRTAYTAGGSILKSYGARGTYYASLGLMNTANQLGDQMRQGDIDSVLSDGHELGCHTFSHSSCRRVPFDLFERDVLTGRDAIRKMTGTDAPHFAYPFGHVSIASKKRMGTHMKSCRGIYPGINGPDADLNLLRANSIYGDMDQFGRIQSLLLENERTRGWLIFYTHDVRRCPSPFGTTPALFDMAVAMAKQKGFRIAPVGEAITIAEQQSRALPKFGVEDFS